MSWFLSLFQTPINVSRRPSELQCKQTNNGFETTVCVPDILLPYWKDNWIPKLLQTKQVWTQSTPIHISLEGTSQSIHTFNMAYLSTLLVLLDELRQFYKQSN